jgi:ABC-2 type transport system permease protein
LCGFMLANYSVVLCGALHTASEGAMTVVIIVTNMNVTLFIFLVLGLPALRDHLHAPTPVWNSAFWTVLSVEIATLAVTLSLPYFVAARRRDFA